MVIAAQIRANPKLAPRSQDDSFARSFDSASIEVSAALTRLPEHERETLQLAYFEELTQAEIARRLDVPLGTVKARSSRGLHRLSAIIRANEEGGAR